MNEKEKDRGAVSSNERIAAWFGFAVIVGIFLEVFSSTDWPPRIANALVGIGVAGEVWFNRRALMASGRLDAMLEKEAGDANKLAAEANKKAAEFNREAAELRAYMAPRYLTETDAKALQSLNGKITELGLTTIVDSEAHLYAQQIIEALKSAGVLVKHLGNVFGPTCNGIELILPDSIDEERDNALKAAFFSFNSLNATMPKRRSQFPVTHNLSPDIPIIFIGEKFFVMPPPKAYVDMITHTAATE